MGSKVHEVVITVPDRYYTSLSCEGWMDYVRIYVERTYWSKLLNDATIFSDQILLLRVNLHAWQECTKPQAESMVVGVANIYILFPELLGD